MLGGSGLALKWPPSITSLQVTTQHESALEIKPLNVQNKGIFYIVRLLQVPLSNTVLQHRVAAACPEIVFHTKNDLGIL